MAELVAQQGEPDGEGWTLSLCEKAGSSVQQIRQLGMQKG